MYCHIDSMLLSVSVDGSVAWVWLQDMCCFKRHPLAYVQLFWMTFCSQMKIFPFSFFPLLIFFCTHFQTLLKIMRIHLVYIITFSIPEYACTPFFDASFICVFTIMRPTDATNNYSTYLWCSTHLHWNVVCKAFS